MSIKLKIILSILCIVALSTFTMEWCAQRLLLSRFSAIESSQAMENFVRFRNAIDSEIERLDGICHDWASWDDAYSFVQDASESFLQTNLQDNVYKINNLNLIAYCDAEGKTVFGGARDIVEDKPIEFEAFFAQYLKTSSPILHAWKSNPRRFPLKGAVMTTRGPLVFACRSVLPSNENAVPMGFLVMGKLLDDETVFAISKRISLRCAIIDFKKPGSPGLLPDGAPIPTAEKPHQIVDAEAIELIGGYPDIEGKPLFGMAVFSDRDFYQNGLEIVRYLRWIILALGFFCLASLFLLIHFTTIQPCQILMNHAAHIYETEDLQIRLPENRRDEFGKLSKIFNAMMEKIAQLISRVKYSEALYRTVSDHSMAMIAMIQRYRIRYANPSLLACSGYREDEIIGMNPLDLIHPDDRSAVDQAIRNARINESWSDSVRLLSHSGETRRVELVASVVSWGEAPAILVHGIDITEKIAIQQRNVELEEKIRQAERMETLGILAGGVAHDLNNILGAIINLPEVLLMKIAADDPLRKSLQMIQDSGKRAAALVEDLLTIGRGSKARHIELSLNAVIRQYLDSAELQDLNRRHPHATIIEDLHEALSPILGSPLHLNKVIMNLVTNAVESLRAPGVVRIRTRNVLVDHPIAGYETVRKGDYVQLTVSDTGMGMEQGDIQRIFQPFFSKKTLAKSGTGLGMTIVWNTVADHDGYIEVESIPEKGTTFHLYFPMAQKELGS